MNLKHAVIFATALSLAPFTAFAGKKAAPPAPAAKCCTLTQVFDASGINVVGAVDFSYDISDNDMAVAGVTNSFRAFDVHPNSFVFHQLNLTISKQWSNGISLVVNPIFGEDANLINAATSRAGVFGADTNNFNLTQAYLSWNYGHFTIMGGKFVTLAGSEVINPAGNMNASRSFLFSVFQPLTHVGVRTSYEFLRGLTFTLGLVNSGAAPSPLALVGAAPAGFGGFATNADTDSNSGKSLEHQMAYSSNFFSTAFTVYMGDEGTAVPFGGDKRQIELYDLTFSITPLDFITFGANMDYRITDALGQNAVGDRLYDHGIANYVNFKITPRARLALRGEYIVIDTNGGAGASDYMYGNGVTATFGYSPLAGLELIAENRHDNFSNALFPRHHDPVNAALPNPGSYYQNTATLKAIYKF